MNRAINISTYEGTNLLFQENTTCNIEDNILVYYTDTDTIKINITNHSFTKENSESILKITPNDCYLTLKSLNQKLEIPLEYLNFTTNNENIMIEYKLESQDSPLKINIKIGEIKNEI